MAVPKAKADGTPFTAPESLPIYTGVCWNITLVSLAGGAVLILCTPLIKRWMHGVK